MGNIIKILIFILLISCTTDEDMNLMFASLGGENEIIPPIINKNITLDFKVGDGQVSTVTSSDLGYSVQSRFLFNNFNLNVFEPDILNHSGWNIDGLQTSSKGDNMPPMYFTDIGNIGGDHGYAAYGYTVVGHNKTIVDDIYSVWQLDGGTDQIILYSINGDVLYFTSTATDAVVSGLYNHVSGAINTSQLNLGGTASRPDIYPNRKLISKKLYVDEVEVSSVISAIHDVNNYVKVVEIYDIVEQESFKDYLVTLQGTGVLTRSAGGDSIYRVTNTFIMDETGIISGLMSGEALVNITTFGYQMFLQQISLQPYDTNLEWYYPKTEPITTADGTFDLTQLVSWQELTETIIFTSTYYEFPTSPPDRQLAILNTSNRVFFQGFLPVKDASIGTRVNIVNEAMTLRKDSEKYYMRGVNSDKVGGSMLIGDKYEVVSYRGVIKQSVDRTALYFVKDYETGKGYMYADWHDLPKVDTIDIPLQYQGKSYTILEKTANVILSNGILGETLAISINNTHNYGFATIEIL